MNLVAVMHCSNQLDSRLVPVLDSLDCNCIPYRLYGKDLWRGYGDKLLTAHRASIELAEFTHILFIDAYDVCVIGNQEEIEEKYREVGSPPWLCMSEVNCWPVPSLAAQHPPQRPELHSPIGSLWPYLNSGSYLAERAYLRDCYERWGGPNISYSHDDQLFLMRNYLAEPGVITLDLGCVLFQSLLGGWHLFEASPCKFWNRHTDTYPLVLHDNGTGASANMAKYSYLWKH